MQKLENAPKVSVLMAVYNCEKYVEEAIKSVILQTYTNWEFLIIDDCSKDKTASIVEKYSKHETRIKFFRMDQNKGQTNCLNFGLRHCNGKYVARLDGDDIMLPLRLEAQVNFLEENSNVGLVGTDVECIDECGTCICRMNTLSESEKLKKSLLQKNPFIHSAVMIRKAILEKVGGYELVYKRSQDYALWIRIAQIADIANIRDCLTKYRILSTSISRFANRKQAIDTAKIKLKSIFNGSLPKISFLFLWRDLFYIFAPAFIIKLRFIYRSKRDRKNKEYFL